MPLYAHTSGEQVLTVPGSREDQRLDADPAWHLANGAQPGEHGPADPDPSEEPS